MRTEDDSLSPTSVLEGNRQFIPLIGYSYPFACSDDAAWLANELKPSLLATQGRLAVIDAEVLVVLPETVKPEHIGRLGFFKFEAGSDAPDRGDSA
jgi:hypothetical protein